MYDLDKLYAEKTRIEGDLKSLEETYAGARKRMEQRLEITVDAIEDCRKILEAHKEAEDATARNH